MTIPRSPALRLSGSVLIVCLLTAPALASGLLDPQAVSQSAIENQKSKIKNSVLGAMPTAFASACVQIATDVPSSIQNPKSKIQNPESASFRAALARIAPSIVRIETIGGALPVEVRTDEDGNALAAPEFRQADGPTTGVIWSADGYIVSSLFNFMRDPTVITVRLADGRTLLAKIVARDRAVGLVLLKVEAADLPAPILAPPAELRPGQWALVAGCGHATTPPALSVGVLSALHRLNGLAAQTDAKISPANYGGPLFDLAGRLIGICVPYAGRSANSGAQGFDWYDSGIGFAVTADLIAARFDRLKRGADLEAGLIAINIDPTEPVVGRPSKPGVGVAQVAPGPAADAGLLAEDRITAVDGRPVETPTAFRRIMALKVAGDSVELTVIRGDDPPQKFTIQCLRAADLPPPSTAPASAPFIVPTK